LDKVEKKLVKLYVQETNLFVGKYDGCGIFFGKDKYDCACREYH